MCIYECVCARVCAFTHEYRGPQKPKSSELPEAVVTWDCVPSEVGAGNLTWILCKTRKHS